MATTSLSLQSTARSRAKYLIFAFVGLMLAYVTVHNESFLINSNHPIWQHYQPFRWYLLPHGLAGACALLLAPLQFSDRLRQRYATFHRVVGRIYVGGVLVAAPMGFYVQYFQERMGATRSFSMAAAVQATSWILTTLIALLLIRKGRVQQHRQWMTRSFSVALVFLEVRVVLGVTGLEQLGPAVVETVVWMCNIFALLSADVILQLQESWRSRPAPSKAQAAAQ
jgi:uncharacterized membrane protein YozB (DUF420 family)